MEIGQTLTLNNRHDWRLWLSANHDTKREIWLIRNEDASFDYLDSVEEAICFGWIDGIAKKTVEGDLAQRFTPRRSNSNWTELNKARAQRLIDLDLMTPAGKVILPSLELNKDVPTDIALALSKEANALEHFNDFPFLYRAVRIGYIVEMRKNPIEFNRRLSHFVKKTALNEMFGNWNDAGRLK
jgi:uncharacterized protein YdeI (YjbR/CyaY-like superfamily)